MFAKASVNLGLRYGLDPLRGEEIARRHRLCGILEA